jgi:hypothetical protein
MVSSGPKSNHRVAIIFSKFQLKVRASGIAADGRENKRKNKVIPCWSIYIKEQPGSLKLQTVSSWI